MKMHCTTCSMIGPKRRNEDSVFAKMYKDTGKGLFIVCDGMGGLHKGDEASKTVTDIFASVWEKHHAEWNTEQMLQEAVASGKAAIDTLSRYDVGLQCCWLRWKAPLLRLRIWATAGRITFVLMWVSSIRRRTISPSGRKDGRMCRKDSDYGYHGLL